MNALANILLIVAVLALLADWRQTLRIFAPDSRWREINPAINALVRRLGAPAGVHLWFGLVCIALGTAATLTSGRFGLSAGVSGQIVAIARDLMQARVDLEVYA